MKIDRVDCNSRIHYLFFLKHLYFSFLNQLYFLYISVVLPLYIIYTSTLYHLYFIFHDFLYTSSILHLLSSLFFPFYKIPFMTDLLIFTNIKIRPAPIKKILKTDLFIALIRINTIEFMNFEYAEIYRIKIRDTILCATSIGSDIYIGTHNKYYTIHNFILTETKVDGSVVDIGFDGQLILSLYRNGKYLCHDMVAQNPIRIFSNNNNIAVFGLDDRVFMNGNSLVVGKICSGLVCTSRNPCHIISQDELPLLFIGTEDGKLIIIDLLNFTIQQIIDVRESAIKSILYVRGNDYKSDSRLVHEQNNVNKCESNIGQSNEKKNKDDQKNKIQSSGRQPSEANSAFICKNEVLHIPNNNFYNDYQNLNDCILVSGADSRLVCLKKLRNQFLKSFQVDTHFSESNSMVQVNNSILTVGDDGYLNIHFMKDTFFLYRRIYSRPLVRIKYGAVVFVEGRTIKVHFLDRQSCDELKLKKTSGLNEIKNRGYLHKPELVIANELKVADEIIDIEISENFIVYSSVNNTKFLRISDLSLVLSVESCNKIYETSGFFFLVVGARCFVYAPNADKGFRIVDGLRNDCGTIDKYKTDTTDRVSNNLEMQRHPVHLASFDVDFRSLLNPSQLFTIFSFHAKINFYNEMHKFYIKYHEQFSILMRREIDIQKINEGGPERVNADYCLDSEICKVRGHVFHIERFQNCLFLLTFTSIYQFNLDDRSLKDIFIGNVNYGMGFVGEDLVLIHSDIAKLKIQLVESVKESKFLNK